MAVALLVDSALLARYTTVDESMTSAAHVRQILAPGAHVAGRYVVIRRIGEGGMGQVFEVEHDAIGRRFALKLLHLNSWNDELIKRFQREARALGKVTSPRVAQVSDFGHDPQVGFFYIMELVEGETLDEKMQRERKIPVREALSLTVEMCEALHDVHETGIIHRDLKPSNVGLMAKGPLKVKLIDFGLATSAQDAYFERITQSQQIIGSLPYMAPERFQSRAISRSVDLYAVGVMLFECLTGQLPFDADSAAKMMGAHLTAPIPPISSKAPEIEYPPMLETVLARLLDKEPEQRFATAEAAARALAVVLKTATEEASTLFDGVSASDAISSLGVAATAMASPEELDALFDDDDAPRDTITSSDHEVGVAPTAYSEPPPERRVEATSGVQLRASVEQDQEERDTNKGWAEAASAFDNSPRPRDLPSGVPSISMPGADPGRPTGPAQQPVFSRPAPAPAVAPSGIGHAAQPAPLVSPHSGVGLAVPQSGVGHLAGPTPSSVGLAGPPSGVALERPVSAVSGIPYVSAPQAERREPGLSRMVIVLVAIVAVLVAAVGVLSVVVVFRRDGPSSPSPATETDPPIQVPQVPVNTEVAPPVQPVSPSKNESIYGVPPAGEPSAKGPAKAAPVQVTEPNAQKAEEAGLTAVDNPPGDEPAKTRPAAKAPPKQPVPVHNPPSPFHPAPVYRPPSQPPGWPGGFINEGG